MRIEDKYIKIKYNWWSESKSKDEYPDDPDIINEGYFVDIIQQSNNYQSLKVCIMDIEGNFMTIDYWLLISAIV